ncbi:Protein F26A3.1 [Aphelenchoides avenae]|nr:Protein F26A3.1 [Aphelenchus avenae]
MPLYREVRWVMKDHLFLAGNPGNEGFYEEFGRQLLTALPQQKDWHVSFYTVSHLNHSPLPVELVKRHLFTERFVLSDQVEHKLDWCRQYLPKVGKLYLVGHSIGAYISLRILRTLLDEGWDVEMCYALFPTVERMADTPNGRRLGRLADFFDRHDLLTKALCLWLNYVPLRLKRWLVSWHLHGQTPKCVVDSAADLFNVGVIRNIIHMANDELHKVCEFDPKLIEEKDRVLFYYGATDGWVPLDFADEMEKRVPGRVIRDKESCEHAFVVRDSAAMGRVIAQLVQNPPGDTHVDYMERKEKEVGADMPLLSQMSA